MTLPAGQHPIDGFPRFGPHLHRPPPAVPIDPVIEISGAVAKPFRPATGRAAMLSPPTAHRARLQATRSTAISSTLGMETTMTVRTDRIEATDFHLRRTALIFAAAVLLHGADHVRRGLDASPTADMVAGSIGTVVVLMAIHMVFWRDRWAH